MVVLAVGQPVRHPGLHEKDRHVERDLPARVVARLEQQRMPGERVRRHRLVHPSALHTHHVVLGMVGHFDERLTGQPPVTQLGERLGGRDGQRRGRGEPGPRRHPARHRDPAAWGRRPHLVQHANDPGEVVGPATLRRRCRVEGDDGAVERGHRLPPLPRPRDHDRTARDREGEHGAAVVVGVLAQQVDAARRGRACRRVTGKRALEQRTCEAQRRGRTHEVRVLREGT